MILVKYEQRHVSNPEKHLNFKLQRGDWNSYLGDHVYKYMVVLKVTVISGITTRTQSCKNCYKKKGIPKKYALRSYITSRF